MLRYLRPAALGLAYLLFAALPAAALDAYLLSAMEKIGPRADLPHLAAGETLQLCTARNEYEACQIAVLNARRAPVAAVVRVATLRDAQQRTAEVQIRIYREGFMSVTRPSDKKSVAGDYPDPLLPLTGPSELAPGKNVYYLEVFTPASARPGEYSGAITVEAGGETRTFTLRLKIWNFTLPARASLQSAFGLDFDSIIAKERLRIGDPKAVERVKQYYRLLADHRLSPISVYPEPAVRGADPAVIDFSASDPVWRYAYDELKFNTLRVPFDERMPVDTAKYPIFSEGYNRRVIAYLSSLAKYLEKNGWLDRAYIYISTVDEPASPAEYRKSRDFYALVKRADPRLSYRHGEQIDFNLQNADACDIIEFNLLAFQRHFRQMGKLHDKKIGWYTAVGPKGDFPTYFIDRPAIEPRVLCWFNYFYHIDRLLYWNTTYWRQVRDPYREPMTYSPRWDLFANGDGSLLYPGAPAALAGPAASLRLKSIRDGMEDYEYLKLYEARAGRDQVVRDLQPLLNDLTHFSRRPDEYERLRQRIGNTLSEGVRPDVISDPDGARVH